MLNWLVTIVLAAGILPSFTALSEAVVSSHASLGKYLGPINALKIASPLLVFFIIRQFRRQNRAIPTRFVWGIGICLVVGTISTWIAAVPCHYPPSFLREWSVMLLGFLAALSLLLLPRKQATVTVLAWAMVIYGSCLIDMGMPQLRDWMYQHLFDPKTQENAWRELQSHWVLTGIFGRQSLAKLLAWMPWVLFGFTFSRPISQKKYLAFGALGAFSTAATLATSQRGPFVGLLVGWFVFAAHQNFKLGKRKMARFACAAVLLGIAFTPLLVSRPILKARLKSLVGMKSEGRIGEAADENRDFRISMSRFSLKMAASHPLGHACIPRQDFIDAGVPMANHSHNLMLEQYRSRGWIWGTVHICLWFLALFGAWKTRSDSSSALVGGITTTLVLGLVDHPWFVLNHSMILWTFLLMGLGLISKRPGETPLPRWSEG